MFHISQLKKALGAQDASQRFPPHLDANLVWVVEPEKVQEIRPKNFGTSPKVLVQWKGLPSSEASWESVESILQHFLDFHLEDKVSLDGGGNDRPSVLFTYSRRGKKGISHSEGEKLNSVGGNKG